MKFGTVLPLLALVTSVQALAADPSPNGITIPPGYKDWRLLGVHQRTDNNTLRAVLGNDVAIQAAREGRTNPWPDGAILAKLVWKNAKHDKWEAAIEPGAFVHAEFMVKNSEKYAATGGWDLPAGWARIRSPMVPTPTSCRNALAAIRRSRTGTGCSPIP